MSGLVLGLSSLILNALAISAFYTALDPLTVGPRARSLRWIALGCWCAAMTAAILAYLIT